MGHVKLLHVIGFSNSGKTTLISNWVQVIKEAGLNVVVIKHHGHGAKLSMPDERKDSMQYLKYGADASIVAGSGYTQHIANMEMDYDQLMEVALLQNPDVVLVEGYKQENGEKVVLAHTEEDWRDLQQVSNIKLVIGYEGKTAYPQIQSREDTDALNHWLKAWLEV